jgi:hypothetical protein
MMMREKENILTARLYLLIQSECRSLAQDQLIVSVEDTNEYLIPR